MSDGWRCPVCGRGVAPSERHCEHGGIPTTVVISPHTLPMPTTSPVPPWNPPVPYTTCQTLTIKSDPTLILMNGGRCFDRRALGSFVS